MSKSNKNKCSRALFKVATMDDETKEVFDAIENGFSFGFVHHEKGKSVMHFWKPA